MPDSLGLGIAFFPWLSLSERVSFGEFTLIPYARGLEPAGGGDSLQLKLDAATQSYLIAHGQPIRRAVLLKVGPHGLPAHLDFPSIERLFRVAELVATSGLSARRFFQQADYWNRDNLRLAIELFTGSTGHVTIPSRRREGRRMDIVTAASHRVYKPDNVSAGVEAQLDMPLLLSLLRASEINGGDRYWEALVGFNQANTDSLHMPVSAELVLLCGAFERLLDCKRGKVDELVAAFDDLLPISRDLEPAESPRVERAHTERGMKTHDTTRESWIRDFVRVRHKPAHGRSPSDAQSIWSAAEHLVLATYFFPLVLKMQLERDGLYDPTEEDRDRVHAFEELLCLESLREGWTPVTLNHGFKRATRMAKEHWLD